MKELMGQTTQYGFQWGPVEIKRVCEQNEGAVINVETKRESLNVYVTKTGFIRLGKVHKRRAK